MATDLHNATTDQTLAALVGGIVHDAQELMKQELALARTEIADELNKTKQALISLAAGVAVAAVGGLLLLLMVVHLLNEVGGLSMWLSYLIVGGALAAVGVGLVFMGRSKAGDVHLVPRRTVETMKENVEWIKNQT